MAASSRQQQLPDRHSRHLPFLRRTSVPSSDIASRVFSAFALSRPFHARRHGDFTPRIEDAQHATS
jgi:hypothetical protein